MQSRSLFSLVSILSLCGAPLGSAATVPAPDMPTNLKVKALGINAFQLTWTDNSTNEGGFEILAGIGKTAPKRYGPLFVSSGNAIVGKGETKYLVMTNDLPGKTVGFQIRAYNGVTGKEKYSKKTPIVNATAAKAKTFDAPTKLKSTFVDDGQVRLTWTDNSTSESGYQIQYKETSSKKWVALNASAGTTFKIPLFGLSPSKSYSFRVRAFRSSPAKATAYSNVVTVTTKAFQAPTNFAVTAESEGSYSFKWKDLSSIEAGYELQYKAPDGDFRALDAYVPNTTSVPEVPGANLDTVYQFRLRAFRMVGTTKTYTDFTPVAAVKSSSLIAPATLSASSSTNSSVTLDWTSSSKLTTGYNLQYRKEGDTDFTSVNVGKVLTYQLKKLVPGKLYDFKVRGNTGSDYSAFTGIFQMRTKDGIIGDLNPPIFNGANFNYVVTVSRPEQLTNLSVTGLPNGLSYNPGNRTISGIATVDGVYTISVTATFADSTTETRSLVLRVVRAPAAPTVVAAFDALNVAVGASKVVSVTNKFADLDTPSAARVETTKGNFDIILYSNSTPLTVDNFLDYADDRRYDNVFFHRSVKDFVLQGGGYKYTSADGFKAVAKYAAVPNEPGISNTLGTVAMAKVSDQPNSATSEFFVNVDDKNPGILDDQNEGFTVFGRVPQAGMLVVEAIAALPTSTYTLTGIGSVENIPMNAVAAPAVLETDKLVKIVTVTAAPILSYTVTSDNSTIATALLTGTDVSITGIVSGSTNIKVKATDLDGNEIVQSIPVTVP